ncbi:MAG: RNA polymerase sigma-54 factor [bacterium]|nr:MAG: RNA polymerase sigma-54 factor [bacterium]
MKNVGLGLQQTQKLVISPQLQHAIKLLQLSSLELAAKVETELSENPFLEEIEESEEKKDNELLGENNDETINQIENNSLEMDINDQKVNIEPFTEGNFFEDSSDFGYIKKSTIETDGNSKQQFLENAFAVEITIYEHLLGQLRLININDLQFHIGEIIISSLDESGYFTSPVEEIADSLGCSVDEILEVLAMVQSLDPPGIAGCDLREVLLIQMDQYEEKNELARSIVDKDLNLLERSRYKELITKYLTTLNEIKKAVKFIYQFEPIPARQFGMKKIKYVVPDISVKRVEGGFSVSVNESFLPHIKVNNTYRKLLQSEDIGDDAKDFFNNKYTEAKLLVFSLDKRKSTIAKVVEQLTEYQRDFFEKGPQYLKPLVLRNIAEKIEMHESTISRVTTNKYIETPWGIFSLKFFFSSGIRKSSGEMKSSRSIKEIIRAIIQNEENDKALSDNKIVKILSNQGIRIARRTVAKYRKSLKIEPSFRRRDI